MIVMKLRQFCYLSLVVCGMISCTVNDNVIEDDIPYEFSDTTLFVLKEEFTPNLAIREGVVCTNEQTMRIVRGEECVAIIRIGEPITVAQAVREESWGYFQFPIIYRAAENPNALIIKWAMQEDSPAAYGQNAGGRILSYDEGQTWRPLDYEYFEKKRGCADLKNGDVLQIKNPSSKALSEYESFPTPVNAEPIGKQRYDFYFEKELPDEFQGCYLTYYNQLTRTATDFHAYLNDPGLLRYSTNGLMPVLWSGTIRQTNDGGLLAGVYGTFYQSEEGAILRAGISFYKSNDQGKHWDIVGKIPYHGLDKDDRNEYHYDGKAGFSEPVFEVLDDGSLFCVMRNENWNVPMCKSFSYDSGKTWSVPEPFTPNGVKPALTLLDNGVLVLASGRPGVQLRVCIDGDGKTWSEPIDMIPFIDKDGKYSSTRETCGYANLLQCNDHTFYLVYSNFLTKDENDESRKSIIFRKIEVVSR